MSVAGVATTIPRVHVAGADGRWRWVVMAFVFALSATLWAFTRIPMAGGLHAWSSQQCVRFEMHPQDWHCAITMERTFALYLAASALVSLAALVPAVVLALKGRRLLAFVPMFAPLSMTLLSHVSSWAWSGFWSPVEHTSTPQLFLGPWEPWTAGSRPVSVWRPDHPLAIGADLLLLAVPVLAVILLFRPARATPSGLSARAVFLACGIAAGASVIVEWVAHAIWGADLYLDGGWFIQGLVIVSFGLLLPLGDRRALWTLPPIACLLSLGGPVAIVGSLHGFTAFTLFRSALPLALMGSAAAGAIAFVAGQRRSAGESAAPQPERLRTVTFAHGVALGVLTLATVAAALDPLPFTAAAALPTYLGARERVIDLRSRMTLDEAQRVAVRYRTNHGSYDGFDARAARDLGPPLLWDDGLPTEDMTFVPELTVRVVRATEQRVELVLVGSETTYCLRTSTGGNRTYGIARAGRPRQRAEDAIASCGARAWTPELLRPFPLDDLCENAPEILICRATQQLLREILASPTGRF